MVNKVISKIKNWTNKYKTWRKKRKKLKELKKRDGQIYPLY